MCLLWNTKVEMYGLFESVPNLHNHAVGDDGITSPQHEEQEQASLNSAEKAGKNREVSPNLLTANVLTNGGKATLEEMETSPSHLISPTSTVQYSLDEPNAQVEDANVNFTPPGTTLLALPASLNEASEKEKEKPVNTNTLGQDTSSSVQPFTQHHAKELNTQMVDQLPKTTLPVKPNIQEPYIATEESTLPPTTIPADAYSLHSNQKAAENSLNIVEPTISKPSVMANLITETEHVPSPVGVGTYKLSSKLEELKELASKMGLYVSIVRESYYFVPKIGHKKTEEFVGHYLRLTDRNHFVQILKFHGMKFIEELEWPKVAWEQVFEKTNDVLKNYFSSML